MDNKQKCLCMIAILIAFMSFAYAISLPGSVFEIDKNNTNLAPNVAGHPFGTGERIDNVTYWANSTPIDLHVFAHASTVGQTAKVYAYIDDVLVSPRSGRPLGSAEEAYRGVDITIPRNSSYRVDFENYHHYEWREYRIISGQNGSVNLTNNYYNISSGADNASLNLKVNKSGDNMTGNLNMGANDIVDAGSISRNGGTGLYNPNSSIEFLSNVLYINHPKANRTEFLENGSMLLQGNLNMSGNNITNCGNCSEFSKLVNRSYNQTGEVFTGAITIPHDDTIPTFTEGNFLLNLTITPKLSTNKLKICGHTVSSINIATPNPLSAVIYYNQTAIGISGYASLGQYYETNTDVCAFISANTTNPTLVTLKYGSTAGTVTINGANGGRIYGGIYLSYLTVDEYTD